MAESVSLPWYIMTSFATDAPTKEFFEKNNFFGLEKDQVIFFKQEEFPCITPEGKIILENKCKVINRTLDASLVLIIKI
jgi:UDP-N-acetylglucosamine/UDP-N-acetylgalactosamine diphosphorylase